MATKNSNNKSAPKNSKYNRQAHNPTDMVLKKPYKNPTETWWGKIIVWLLVFGMVGGIILSFILSIINNNA
jgi:hypothetical protein